MDFFLIQLEKTTRTLSLALRSLWLHKLRAFLSVLGIIIGTAAVISLMAFGEGSMHDALEDIKQFADKWERSGDPRLEVWSRGGLFRKFLKAHGNYIPDSIADFRNFVDLYAGPFDAPLPKAKFARLLEAS